MPLRIDEEDHGGITVLKLSGRVTLGDESSQLRNRIKDILDRGKTRLILDLAEVSYIDSAGLGTLVAGFTTAQSQGASVKLVNLTRKFREQLHITKLVTVFEVYDTLDEAIKSFGRAAP